MTTDHQPDMPWTEERIKVLLQAEAALVDLLMALVSGDRAQIATATDRAWRALNPHKQPEGGEG